MDHFFPDRRSERRTINMKIRIRSISHRLRLGNESPVITALFSTVRTEFGSRNLNPTVAKQRDRGVFSCAGGEIEPLIRRIRKGLRRSDDFQSLSPDAACDTEYSHAWPLGDPIPPQNLCRLSVSRRPGYQGVAFALSVPPPQGWLRSRETKTKKHGAELPV